MNAIVKASVGIFIITFLVKIIGYVEKLVLAFYFGTELEVDIYSVISATILSVFVFFREVVEPGFLNSFLSAHNKDDSTSAWRIFNFFARIILVATVLATLLVELFPMGAIELFAPGFTGEKKELAVQIIRIAFPASVFLALSSLTNITLNAFKNFIFPATADLAFRGLMVVSLFVFTPVIGIYSMGVGLLIGAIAKVLIHLSRLHQNISYRRISLPPADRNNIIRLTWPLLVGVSFSQFNTIIDNIFASYLQHGALSSLGYSKKIVELPILIFPYLLSTILFPFFSHAYIKGESRKTRELLSVSIKWIIIVFVPLSIFFLLYGYSIVAVIFQRGAFNEASTILTAKPFMLYSAGMLFFAIETILVIYFFANNNTLLPILVGMGCVVLNIAITYFTIDSLGYLAIALAYVISKTLKVCILLAVWFIKDKVNMRTAAGFAAKVVFGAFVFYLVHLLFNYLIAFEYTSMIRKLVHMACAGTLAIVVYAYTIYRLKLLKSL